MQPHTHSHTHGVLKLIIVITDFLFQTCRCFFHHTVTGYSIPQRLKIEHLPVISHLQVLRSKASGPLQAVEYLDLSNLGIGELDRVFKCMASGVFQTVPCFNKFYIFR